MTSATGRAVTRDTSARRPTSLRREATRSRLLAAAEEVFAERGIHGASVEDICERAHFTRGAFYSNFRTREELVLELYQQHAQRLQTAVAELAARPGLSVDELLEGVVRIWVGDPVGRRRWHLLTTELGLQALRDPDARSAWAATQRSVRRDLVRLVGRIVDEHGLHLAVDPDHFVRMLTIVLQGALGQHLLEPRAVPPGSLERELLPLLVAATTH